MDILLPGQTLTTGEIMSMSAIGSHPPVPEVLPGIDLVGVLPMDTTDSYYFIVLRCQPDNREPASLECIHVRERTQAAAHKSIANSLGMLARNGLLDRAVPVLELPQGTALTAILSMRVGLNCTQYRLRPDLPLNG